MKRDQILSKVREHRLKAGITQAELAQAVGVTRQSIISIEAGRYIPSLQLALRFSEYFNCPVETLFQRRKKQ